MSEESAPGVDIAVIGMSGRFPNAPDLDAYWRNLVEGVDCVRRFSDEELDEAGVPAQLRQQPGFVPARAIVDEADCFDAGFFGLSPAEARTIDPQQRLFLETAWSALEDAGIDPARAEGLIGVYAGADEGFHVALRMVVGAAEMGTLIGNNRDYLATRTAFKLDLKGPALTIQTACSTSLVAIQAACQSLLGFQCDVALAGGVGLGFPQKAGYVHVDGGVLSPDGITRPFDANGKGTVGGDGCGVVVLKRLDEALEDGDPIHAVIAGAAINNDGAAKVGFSAPSTDGQAEVVAMAQAMAEVDPREITYVEAHGTGTPLGDPIEIAALDEVFKDGTDDRGFCWIGSVKSNCGHMNSASGVGGLIKAVLALEHGEIPPSLYFNEPNPQIDFTDSCFRVVAERTPFEPGPGGVRYASVSSFGVGGTNAHAVLREAPEPEPSGPGRSSQLFLVSGRTEDALDAATANLLAHLEGHPEANPDDVAYTLQTGRRLFKYRRMAVGSPDGLLSAPAVSCDTDRTPVAMLFPGQGAQFPGMLAGLHAEEPRFAEVFDALLGDWPALHGAILDPGSDPVALQSTAWAQPALFAVEYALARLWQSFGVEPAALLGHSVGEYVAACLSGVFSPQDGLALVTARGRLMQECPTGSMLAVQASAADLPAVDGVAIAGRNAPGVTVVSGPDAAIDAMDAACAQAGIAARRLHTSHAFHSASMDAVLAPFREVVAGIELSAPEIPVLSNLTGTWLTEAEARDPDYWVQHLRQAVRFEDGVATLLAEPDQVLLEVGPGRGLSSLVRRHGPEARDRVFRSGRTAKDTGTDWAAVLQALGGLALAGVPIDWAAVHEGSGRRAVHLPTYPFQRERFPVDTELKLASAGGAAADAEKKDDVADWLYRETWTRAEPARPTAAGGTWIVLEADGCDALLDRLAAAGARLLRVRRGDGFAGTATGFTVDPRSPDDWSALVDHLPDAPSGVVHLWSLDDGDTTLSEACDRGVFALAGLARALGTSLGGARVRVVTRGVADVTGSELLRPFHAALVGATRVVGQEIPGVDARLVDIDGLDAHTGLLCDELLSAGPDRVALRGRHRWTPSAVPLAEPAGDLPISEGSTWLITGGLGSLGMILAGHLAKRGANLVLTSRKGLVPPDERDAWLASHPRGDAQSRRIRAVRALEADGATVLVATADVADRERMTSLIAEIRQQFGPVHGVVHAAGSAGREAFAPVAETDPRGLLAQLRPKAEGAVLLDELLGDEPAVVLLMSSLSTWMGGVGLLAYTASNCILDALARSKARTDGPRWVAPGWDAWIPAEHAALMGAGVPAILPDEGVLAFEAVLARTEPAPIVSTMDLDVRAEHAATMSPFGGPGRRPRRSDGERHPRPELDTAYVEARDDLEHDLVSIWEELFEIDGIGVEDNFFALGGDSLMAIDLKTRIRDDLGVDLPVNDLFEQPTIASVARQVVSARESKASEQAELERMLAMVEGLSDEEVAEMLGKLDS